MTRKRYKAAFIIPSFLRSKYSGISYALLLVSVLCLCMSVRLWFCIYERRPFHTQMWDSIWSSYDVGFCFPFISSLRCFSIYFSPYARQSPLPPSLSISLVFCYNFGQRFNLLLNLIKDMFRIWRLFVLFCQAFGMPQYNWIREAYYIPMRPPHRSLYTFVLISSAFRIFWILCGGPNRIYFQQFSPFSFWPLCITFVNRISSIWCMNASVQMRSFSVNTLLKWLWKWGMSAVRFKPFVAIFKMDTFTFTCDIKWQNFDKCPTINILQSHSATESAIVSGIIVWMVPPEKKQQQQQHHTKWNTEKER